MNKPNAFETLSWQRWLGLLWRHVWHDDRAAWQAVPDAMAERLVRRVPGSNRLSLYLSSHIGAIDGMPVPEAMAMVRDLIEHATQRQFVYRHVWRVHDLVIWDNRATMHRARAFDDNRQPRDMRRATLQDIAPTLEQPA